MLRKILPLFLLLPMFLSTSCCLLFPVVYVMNGRPYMASQRFFDAMKAANISKPLGTELHHIVPAGDAAAAKARDVLAKHGIGINSVANGVYLPNHKGRHTIEYSEGLVRRLNDCNTRDEVLTELNKYRNGLLNGTIKLYKD